MENIIKEQKDFFSKVIKLKKSEKARIKVYQELVFHRFFEVITNANPILNSLIGEKKFEKVIAKFIKDGAKTDLIWQLPNEFRKYVKNNRTIFKDMPYIDDLLWFEWIEIELFMKDYSSFKKNKFDMKNSYKLSYGAKLKKLSYKVYEKEFKTKDKYTLLAYYDQNLKEVIYREISPFMYDFLKLIGKMSIKDAIKDTSKKYELEAKDLKEILVEPLKELCSLGVLVKKD